MNSIGYFLAKIKCKLKRNDKEVLNRFFRKQGVKIREKTAGSTKISSNILSAEPYLINIGENVTISHDVQFITHDNSVCKLFGIDHDLYGQINIGNNCFIGACVVILYGVTIPDNVIVAAGSVVTKSPPRGNIIIAGNPARIINEWDGYREKTKNKEIHAGYLSYEDKKSKVLEEKEKWIVR